jgi:peptide/nickel transport system substrate-binding protein
VRRSALPLAAVLLTALLTALTACAGPPGTGTGTAVGSKQTWTLSAATPAPKGDINSFSWALYAESPTLDFISAFDYPQNMILSNVCESLMSWTPKLTEVPGLAQSVQNPNPTTWIYNLRPNVHFQGTGQTLTANDAVFSMDRTWTNPNSDWGQIYQNVKTITATGPLQVTVKLTRPDAFFNQYMATAAGVIASKAVVTAEGANYGTQGSLGCTGPFELGQWIKGQSIELNRFQNYWGTPAKSAHVIFDFLSDPAEFTNALLTGEVDGAYLVPPQSYARLEAAHIGSPYFGQALTTVNINIDSFSGVLGNVKVRQALSLALDRNGFVKTGLAGVGTATSSITPRAAWTDGTETAAFGNLPSPAQNIAEAKQLIKEAGAEGKTITLATSPVGPDTSILPTALQSAGEEIGLNVVLKTVSPDGYTALFSSNQARKGLDMFPETYYLSITDPFDILDNFQTGNFQDNAGYSNPVYDKLINEASATYNTAARLKIEARINQLEAQQVLWIPVAEWPNALFMDKRITGAPTTIAYMYYPWAADVGAAQ